jgi:hypothetical protein
MGVRSSTNIVVLAQRNPALLKRHELAVDDRGRVVQGLGEGNYRILGELASTGQQTAPAATPAPSPSGATGVLLDGSTVANGLITAIGTTSAVPMSSLWELDGDGDLQLSGFLDGATGLWAVDVTDFDPTPGTTTFPDLYWERDGDGNLQPKEGGS